MFMVLTPTSSWMVPLGAQILSASLSPPGSVNQLCSISSTPWRPNPSSSSSARLSWSSGLAMLAHSSSD